MPFQLKIALRTLWKQKLFTAINLVGLAISLCCCLLIGWYVWQELQHDKYHSKSDRIYRLTQKQNQAGQFYHVAVTPGPLAPALAKDFPQLEQVVRIGQWWGVVKANNKVLEEKNILLTDASFFQVFDQQVLLGNGPQLLTQPTQVVFTAAAAERYFGPNWASLPGLIGSRITLNKTDEFTLAGVVANVPANSSIQYDILLPLSWLIATDKWSNQWGSNNYHTYVVVRPETNLAQLTQQLQRQLGIYHKEAAENQLQLQPLYQQYLHSRFDFNTDWGKRSNIVYVQIFGGVGLLLLLIACVNFITLSTARAAKRAPEIGVRKVNGATRWQLVRQFLGESVLMAAIAALISLGLVRLAAPAMLWLTGTAIEVNYSSLVFWLMLLALVVAIGLLAGWYPAWLLSSPHPIAIMRSKSGAKESRSILKALVVVQFTIAMALMICTFFMNQQLQFAQQKDLGYQTNNLIGLRLGGKAREQALALKADLLNNSSILAATPSSMSLLNVDNQTNMQWKGQRPDDAFLITQANVDPDFIPAMGMQLIAGKNFTPQAGNDTSTFIINASAAKRMGMQPQEVLGVVANIWGAEGKIIGVVNDFHYKTMYAGIEPFIFRYQPKDRYFNLFVRIAPGKTAEAIAHLEKVYKQYDADVPADWGFVSERLQMLYQPERRTANLVLLFASLTVIVGCLGLFGLTVYAAEQRVREVGIRKVLGAGAMRIAVLLSKDFMLLVLLATVLAVPLAWYASNQWLQQFAYRIPMQGWVFAAAVGLVGVAALLTTGLQAARSARANPADSLRAS